MDGELLEEVLVEVDGDAKGEGVALEVVNVHVISKHQEEALSSLLVFHDRGQLVIQQVRYLEGEEFHCSHHYNHERTHSTILPEFFLQIGQNTIFNLPMDDNIRTLSSRGQMLGSHMSI